MPTTKAMEQINKILEPIKALENCLPLNSCEAMEAGPYDPYGFTPFFGNCDAHGPYPMNVRDPKTGGTRWYPNGGCPVCRHQAKADELADRAVASRTRKPRSGPAAPMPTVSRSIAAWGGG